MCFLAPHCRTNLPEREWRFEIVTLEPEANRSLITTTKLGTGSTVRVVTGDNFNNANPLTSEFSGGPIELEGTIDRAVSSVEVDGKPAAVRGKTFSADVDAGPGRNRHRLTVVQNNGTAVEHFVEYHLLDGGINRLDYDLNGNLVSATPGHLTDATPTREYEWDAKNRLTAIVRNVGDTVYRTEKCGRAFWTGACDVPRGVSFFIALQSESIHSQLRQRAHHTRVFLFERLEFAGSIDIHVPILALP